MGFVRALWKLDVTYRAFANSQTLAPIETQQTESYRSKKIATHLTFTNSGVTRLRTEGEGAAAKTTTRDFTLPNLFDLHSAALYLRSQPLKQGSVYRVRDLRGNKRLPGHCDRNWTRKNLRARRHLQRDQA